MNICSLHKIPEDGSESAAYIAQDEAAQTVISHDGDNRVFMHTHELETNAVKAYELDLTLDERAMFFAKILVEEHPPIHDYQHNFSALFRHPMHRLWCACYDDEALFQSDIQYVAGMIEASGATESLELWQESTDGITYDQAPGIMLNLIRSLSAA